MSDHSEDEEPVIVRDETAALQREIERLRKQLESVTADFAKERQLLRASVQDVERLKQDAERQLQDRTEQCTRLRAELAAFRAKAETEASALRVKLAETQAALTASEQRLPAMPDSSQEREVRGELRKLTEAYRLQLQELEAMRTARETDEREHAARLAALEKHWSAKVDAIRAQAETAHASSAGAVDDLRAQLSAAMADAKEARAQLASALETVAARERDIAFLQQTVRDECEERAELLAKLSALQQQCAAQQQHIQQLQMQPQPQPQPSQPALAPRGTAGVTPGPPLTIGRGRTVQRR